ncbi:MAG: hypothetical protein ABW278_15465 [Steroidobacteraceae bacterium]
MNMIERYLASVAWRLPPPSRDDIVSELRDDILSRIEAAEARGAAATEAQISAVLRATGHPATVAARFAAQDGLLPPEAVPWFWAHLRALAILVAVLQGAGALVAGFAGQRPEQAIAQAVGQGAVNMLQALGALLLAYLCFSRYLYPRLMQKWDPAKLPAPPAPGRDHGSTLSHAIGLVFGIVMLLWWAGAVQLPAIPSHLQPGPVWESVFVPVLLLLAMGVALQLVELFAPSRRRLIAALAVGIAVASFALGNYLLRHGPLLVAADDSLSARAMAGINAAGGVILIVIMTASVFEAWQRARQLFAPRAACSGA